MNRFKCPACGGNQYTSCDTAEGRIYCGHKELKKMETLARRGSMSNKYIKLSDLAQVPGIGKKTLERIQNTVKIYTFDKQTNNEEKINLTNWLDELDEIFEGI